MFSTSEFRDRPRRVGRWLLIAAAAGAVVGLIVWATAGGPSPSVPAGGSVSPAPAPTSTTRPTQEAPTGLEWKLINGVRLPFSASDGPTGSDGPHPIGFTHSPQGAMLAAWQLSTRLLTDPDVEGLMTRVHGTFAEQQVIRDGISTVRGYTADELAAAFAQPVAYRIDTFTDIYAAIYFAVPSGQGGYDFQARAVVWTASGWEYQLVSGLERLPNSTSLAGFTALR